MLAKLLLLFVLVPLVELVLLIKINDVIAVTVGDGLALLLMVGWIVVTGILGGFLAKREGISILRRLQSRLATGQVPGSELLNGAIVLVSGALLITPGVLTDIAGFLGLWSLTRALLRRWTVRWFKNLLQNGTIRVTHQGQPINGNADKEDPIDIG